MTLPCLAACSSSFSQGPPQAPAELPPPYREIIAQNLLRPAGAPSDPEHPAKMFPSTEDLGMVEVSGVRRVFHFTGWTWLACLRVNARQQPVTYAVFIRDSAVVDWRSNVQIDRCEAQVYQPLGTFRANAGLTLSAVH